MRRLITLIYAGWIPHDFSSSRSCLCLKSGVRPKGLSYRVFEGSPVRGCAPAATMEYDIVNGLSHLLLVLCLFSVSWLALIYQQCFGFNGNCPDKTAKFPGDSGCDDLFGFPFGPEMSIAFQEISRMLCGKFSCLLSNSRLTLALYRYDQAASTSIRRTCVLPALVIGPRLMLSPVEYSDGTRPR